MPTKIDNLMSGAHPTFASIFLIKIVLNIVLSDFRGFKRIISKFGGTSSILQIGMFKRDMLSK